MAEHGERQVRAWDWPTRAFHWLLVWCIASAWVSTRFSAQIGDPTLKWHRWNGYAILILLVFRLIWGVLGSSTSRFSAFVKGPVFTTRYALDFLKGRKRPFLGHNPLGTVMILALLAIVGTQGILGLFTLEHNEITAGPLKRFIDDATTEWVSKLHVRLFDFILIFVVIHITANLGYALIAKEPLIRAMFTGKKPPMAYEDEREAMIDPGVTMRALVCLAAAIIFVFGGITLAGGRII